MNNKKTLIFPWIIVVVLAMAMLSASYLFLKHKVVESPTYKSFSVPIVPVTETDKQTTTTAPTKPTLPPESSSATSSIKKTPLNSVLDPRITVLIRLINDERIKNKLSPLTEEGRLDRAAQDKTEDEAGGHYFSHTSPNYGLNFVDFANGNGYKFTYLGENLAIDFNDFPSMVQAWMDSPKHRENILNPSFTETGIGLTLGTYEGHQTLYVAQYFGTPTK